MNKQPTVSILMAIHKPNRDYLKLQVQSLFEQTFEDWQCIISDDSKTPETKSYVLSLIENDSRFSYVEFKAKPSVVGNFENAYANRPVDTEYYCFCDQDDIWTPDKIESLLNEFKLHPKVSLIHSDGVLIDKKGDLINESLWSAEGRNVQSSSTRDLLLKNNITGCMLMCRASVLALACPFPIELSRVNILHDQWVGVCASLIGDGVFSIDKKLVQYRQHSGNVVGYAKKRRLNDFLPTVLMALREAPEYSLSFSELTSVLMGRVSSAQKHRLLDLNFGRGIFQYFFKNDLVRSFRAANLKIFS